MQLPPQVSPPAFELSDAAPSRVEGVDVLALPVLRDDSGAVLGPGAATVADDLGLDLDEVLDRPDVTGAVAEIAAVHLGGDGPHTVLFIGVGDASPASCRRAGAALARRLRGIDSVATSLAAVGDDENLAAVVEGIVLASFRFSFRETRPEDEPVRRVVLAELPGVDGAALRRAEVVARAAWRSRTLATVPANVKNPAWMADRAAEIAEAGELEIEVWDEKRLERDGFGGILAVGSGSASPPRFVRLAHRPRRGGRRAPHVVLVGKGITFDSGGLNIKPGESMRTMKRDMTGAGIVMSVLGALRELDCPLRVTGLLCLAENAVGGAAMRPGDVLTHVGGRTTEVVNTDAEGRLVLADGMAYAVGNLKPDVLVDVATLTGAVKVALGLQTGGLYANDDVLADRLLEAGERSGEPLWRLPLVAEYEPKLASPVADAINSPTEAASITAALFLQHFAGTVPWAHLDLSSVGDATERDEWTAGPSGFGARVLLRWLTSTEPLDGIAG